MLLTPSQIDWLISLRGPMMLSGFWLMALTFMLPRGWGCGAISGFMLFSLGIYGLALRNWRTERGIWMLALFLTLTEGPLCAYFEYLHWSSLFAAPQPNQPARPMTWDQIRLSVIALSRCCSLRSW